MAQVSKTIQIPTELSLLGDVAQQLVSDLSAGKPWLSLMSGLMPVIFQESMKVDEIKAELKDPQALVLLGVVLGQLAGKAVQDMAAKAAAKAQLAEAAPAAAAASDAAPKIVEAPAIVVAPGEGDSSQA